RPPPEDAARPLARAAADPAGRPRDGRVHPGDARAGRDRPAPGRRLRRRLQGREPGGPARPDALRREEGGADRAREPAKDGRRPLEPAPVLGAGPGLLAPVLGDEPRRPRDAASGADESRGRSPGEPVPDRGAVAGRTRGHAFRPRTSYGRAAGTTIPAVAAAGGVVWGRG